MRTPKENIYLILLSTLGEIFQKTIENLKSLFFGNTGSKSGIIYSIFHHILVLGPKKFQSFPTGIAIGRGIFSPFILLFKKSSQGNQR